MADDAAHISRRPGYLERDAEIVALSNDDEAEDATASVVTLPSSRFAGPSSARQPRLRGACAQFPSSSSGRGKTTCAAATTALCTCTASRLASEQMACLRRGDT